MDDGADATGFTAMKEIQNFNKLSSDYARSHSPIVLESIGTVIKNINAGALIEKSSESSTAFFFVNLHSLLSSIELDSELTPIFLDLLQNVCANVSQQEMEILGLSKFIPVLVRFTSLNVSMSLKVLFILSIVTHKVKIAWEEAYLSTLIPILVKNVLENSGDVRKYSLVSLINLCYENLPVLYVFMRKVDAKTFIKSLTEVHSDPTIRILMYKMLVILQEVKGPLPEPDAFDVIVVTIDAIHNCFQRKDTRSMGQMVDFFVAELKRPNLADAVLRYRKCDVEVKRLLDLMEEEMNGENNCIGNLLDFLPCLLTSRTSYLLPRIISSTLKWIDNPATTASAIKLLLTILKKTANTLETQDELVVAFQRAVSVLCGLLRDSHVQSKTLGVLSLIFLDLQRVEVFRDELLKVLSVNGLKMILMELLKDQSKDSKELFVRLMCLTSMLSQFHCEWLSLYENLLTFDGVLQKIAEGFIIGDRHTKIAAFYLLKGSEWNDDNLIKFSDLLIGWPFGNAQPKETLPFMPAPLYSFNQESRLNGILSEIQTKNLSEIPASNIMELCRFQLLLAEHEEKRLKTWLAAADASNTALKQQNDLLKSEMNHFTQMLFHKQQILEETTWERKKLLAQLSERDKSINSKEEEISFLKQEVQRLLALNSSTMASLEQSENASREKDSEIAALQSELANKDTEIQNLERIRQVIVNVANRQAFSSSIAGSMSRFDSIS